MQQVVLVMKEVEGMSCEEIAAALRCSVATVISRLEVKSATLSPASVAEGKTSTGTVTLDAPAGRAA
jgi:transposase